MKNIKISYILTYLDSSWFWLGIWLIFYLRFTDYAGVGILETTAFLSLTLSEIPTGAIADLVGKKYTLLVGFILSAIASIIMGFATEFNHLLLSLIILAIGGALRSGTLEALQYDSLKDEAKEGKYPIVVSNTNTIRNIAYAFSAAVGGYMYSISPGLPFIALGILFFVASFLCLFITEPQTDSAKFSWKIYTSQTAKGFHHLFKKGTNKNQTINLLSISMIIFISYQFIDSALAIEFGFDEKQLGILSSIVYIASAIISQFTSKIMGAKNHLQKFTLLGLIAAITLLISPLLGLVTGGLILVFRQSLSTLMDNTTSLIINKNTPSNIRTTTISTYNMIRNTPYILTAYLLGGIIDTHSATSFAVGLSIILILVSIINPTKPAIQKS